MTGTGAKVTVVKHDGNQISGNFSLAFKGYSTGSVIPFNATAAQMKAYLEGLQSIPSGTLQVTRTGPDLQMGKSCQLISICMASQDEDCDDVECGH